MDDMRCPVCDADVFAQHEGSVTVARWEPELRTNVLLAVLCTKPECLARWVERGATGERGHGTLAQALETYAPIAVAQAPTTCLGGYVDPDSCAWYHGAWPYLRAFGAVSSPEWHRDFYGDALRQVTGEHAAPRVLVSGCADFSMLDQVMRADGSADGCQVTVTDRCQTPLDACRWYADHLGASVSTWRGDIMGAPACLGPFEVITTDAFLTRFDAQSAAKVIDAWRALLAPGGAVVTTVRAHERDERREDDGDVAAFAAKVRDTAHRRSAVDLDFVEGLAHTYARRMCSADLGGAAEVCALFADGGFDVRFLQAATVPGEFRPVDYLRIVARKRA